MLRLSPVGASYEKPPMKFLHIESCEIAFPPEHESGSDVPSIPSYTMSRYVMSSPRYVSLEDISITTL